MEKKSILKKIDEMYTKATQIIIGDIPHDGDTAQEKTKNIKKINLKDKMISLKEKILTIGTPDEKSVAYKEIVKKEKQALKDTITLNKTIEKSKKVSRKKVSSKPELSKKKSTETKTSTPTKKSPTQKTRIKKKPIQKELKTKKEPTKNKKTTSIKTVTPKKENTTKIKESKKNTMTKTKPEQRGAKKAAKIALYIKDIRKHYGEVDEAFVAIIVKNLGPSIYKKDAELVSCSDPKELDTVRKNFLIKKLGIDASQGVLDAAIQDVCTELKGVRTKYRATFYYALAKKFKKESTLS